MFKKSDEKSFIGDDSSNAELLIIASVLLKMGFEANIKKRSNKPSSPLKFINSAFIYFRGPNSMRLISVLTLTLNPTLTLTSTLTKSLTLTLTLTNVNP